MIRVELTEKDRGPGRRSGRVINNAGEVIGEASDYIYGGRGFAVHTKEFAGFMSFSEVIFVGRHLPNNGD